MKTYNSCTRHLNILLSNNEASFYLIPRLIFIITANLYSYVKILLNNTKFICLNRIDRCVNAVINAVVYK